MQNLTVDYSRKWYVMMAVAMGIFLATIDGSIVNVALPTLVRDFGTVFAAVQWVVLSYLLTVTTLMLGIGRLADMVGKKRIYVSGFIIFTVGSTLCALSPTIYFLIGFRVLQAIGAAMIMALGIAIVTESFPPQERGKAIGITGSIVSVGIVVGPTLGGLIIDAASWHWIFLVNLPIGILGTILASRFIPDLRPAGGQRFDYWGAFTLFCSILGLSLGLTLAQERGFGDPLIVGLLTAWAVFLALFLAIEWRVEQPMIDLRLFRNYQFSVNLGTGFITFVGISGLFILLPFYLEDVLGYEVRLVGLMLAIIPVALGVMAPISGSLSDRYGSRPITVIGLAVLLVGYGAASTLSAETTVLGYVARLLPIGLGMGIFQSPNNSAVMGAAPRERLGVASGLLSITRTLGQVTGISVLGTVWAARATYHAGQALPGGATEAPAWAQVAALRDTLLVTLTLVAVALAVAIWAFVRERRLPQSAPSASAVRPRHDSGLDL
ncbi:MFS transporter [Litorilinea aerophila]|uniref:MFS transporter n=1 Tax=Litorilinea aerophila TaxID=1204385 RepID=A0A540VGJ4_9CHLR|nr:MFS transporter [Litorilinea aerophila]MCC9076581.1 MFS transporter [Litorilinea aerophila]GIV79959.1 MAG: MFS transporter [Litorilinea sp.]